MRKIIQNVKARERVVYRGHFINFLKLGRWEYVKRNNCTAIVIIIAMSDDQKVVFTEQYRPPVKRKVLEFPAGLVNDQKLAKKETILKAAERELLEETGYQAKKMVKLMEGPVSSGLTSDLVTFVQAIGIKKVAKGGGDQTENIKVHTIPLANVEEWLLQMTKKKYLFDPKIYAGLYFLNKYNDNLFQIKNSST